MDTFFDFIMSKSPPEPRVMFNIFVENPKDVSIETVLGAHKYIARKIRLEGSDSRGDPTLKTLIKLTMSFTNKSTKAYVLQRLGKNSLRASSLYSPGHRR